jgi:aldehyde:ferredoxin oxidoreductase
MRGYSMKVEWFAPMEERLDPFAEEGKAQAIINLQHDAASIDSVGMCDFSAYAVPPERQAELYEACTGEKITREDWDTIGERVWNLERLFNNGAGLTVADDSLPPRMTDEPLNGGAVQNQVVALDVMLAEYYERRGWDDKGNPTSETLDRLGISQR